LVTGRRSQAELAQNEALSVCSASITVSTKPRQRAADHSMAVISGQKRPRQKASTFDGDLALCQTVGYEDHRELMQDYYKTEPVCVFSVEIFYRCLRSRLHSPFGLFCV